MRRKKGRKERDCRDEKAYLRKHMQDLNQKGVVLIQSLPYTLHKETRGKKNG